jgi:hypothetical protein
MKSCPECNRTFSDETLSFCLVDGAILSAPYDPQATLVIPEPRATEPPPTEVLKLEETKQEIPPTVASPQPEQKPEELVSTIAAPVPALELPEIEDTSARPALKPSLSPFIMVGVGALLMLGLILLINSNRAGSTNENAANTATLTANTTNTATVATVSNSNQTRNTATPSPSPSPTPVISLEGTVWEGLVDNEYQRTFEFKSGGKVIEKSGGKVGDKSPMDTYSGTWTLQGNRVFMKIPGKKGIAASEIEATILGDEMTGEVRWPHNPLSLDTLLVRKIR